MKKWEYRVEGLDTKNFNDEKSVKELKDFLAQIGSDGWELINIIPTSRSEEQSLTHKDFVMKKCILIFKKEMV